MIKFSSIGRVAGACLLWVLGSHAIAARDSGSLIQEFNRADTGIAFTMLSRGSWENPGNQSFCDNPLTPQKSLQAITISNATKKLMPYQGDTRYGLAFSIAESSGFYKYFATKSRFSKACGAGKAEMVTPLTTSPAKQYNQISNWAVSCGGGDAGEQIAFCGRCFDGGVCAGSGNIPNTPDKLWPALGEQVPFSEFQTAKNAIVSASGSTSTCSWATAPNIWNEFNTNGLSRTALVGVLVDKTSAFPPGTWKPSEPTLCAYLQNVDPSRNNWPVYILTFNKFGKPASNLELTKTISCQ